MYKKLLSNTFFTILSTEHDDVIASLKLEHIRDGIGEISYLPDYQGYENTQLVQTVTLSLTNTLPSLTLQVWAVKVKKESEKKVSMIIKEFLEKKKQENPTKM